MTAMNTTTAELADLILSAPELRALTGCARPTEQVAELKRQGFYRARRARDGSVVLERAHYLSVCDAAFTAANEPRLRL